MNKKLSQYFPICLVIYEFAVNSSNDMYLPGLIEIVKEFHTSEKYVQFTLSSWLAGSASFQLFFGPLSDRVGRKKVLLGGGVLFLLATLLCILSNNIKSLIFFRFLQGVGVCTLMVSGYAAIHELYSEKKAIQILAWMGSIAVIAPLAGPSIGGLILTVGSWRTVFWVIFFLGAVTLVLLGFVMPESNLTPDREALNLKRLRQVYTNIVCNRSFICSAFTSGFMFAAIMAWISASPFLLMNYYLLTPEEYGLIQIPIFGSFIIGSLAVKKWIEKMEMRELIWLGLWVALLASGGFIVSTLLFPRSLAGVVASMMILSVGFGLSVSCLSRRTLMATKERVGVATAVFSAGNLCTGALGSFFASETYNDTSFSIAALIAVFIVIATGLNWIEGFRPSKKTAG